MATAEVQSATAALVEEVVETPRVQTKDLEEALEKVKIATDAATETTPPVETGVAEAKIKEEEPPATDVPAPAASAVAGDPEEKEKEDENPEAKEEEEDKAPAA